MHLSNHLIILAPALALAAPSVEKRAGEATLQTELESEVGALRNDFDALCAGASSVLQSGAGEASGSLQQSLIGADSNVGELCHEIAVVLADVGKSAASNAENFRDADESARGMFDVGTEASSDDMVVEEGAEDWTASVVVDEEEDELDFTARPAWDDDGVDDFTARPAWEDDGADDFTARPAWEDDETDDFSAGLVVDDEEDESDFTARPAWEDDAADDFSAGPVEE